MDIIYRRHDPFEIAFLRGAIGVRRAEAPQQHDGALDSTTDEMTRISKEFRSKKAVTAVAYLAIINTTAEATPDITAGTAVGYAYGFERKTPRRARTSRSISTYVELGGVNIRKECKGHQVALTLAQHTLRGFDESLPLLDDGNNAVGLLLGGALDDPHGKGSGLQNPQYVHEALQILNQTIGVQAPQPETQLQELSQSAPQPQPAPHQLTITGGSLYSTA
jgi:hypothetical protein